MHTKVLIRTDSFIEHYQHWLQKEVIEVIEILSGSYANEVFGKGADDFKFETQASHNRIYWQPLFLTHHELGFLIDYFKTKLLQNGYVLSLSDERHEIFDSGLRLTIHRHYLKPEKAMNAEKTYLNFGNLFLEHQFNNKQNKFCLTVNFGGHENRASFEKLMEFLLGE